MKLSAKTRYAVRILLCLARYDSLSPVPSSWLAARTDISAQFIEQILQRLRRAGITDSIRGAHGGHVLLQQPADVSIAKILDIIYYGGWHSPFRLSGLSRQMWSMS